MASGKSIFKNASWIVVCSIVQALISLIIGMISARYLGPDNYGLISYASSIVMFIVPVVQLGFRNTLVQEVVASPDKEGETLGTILLSSIVCSFFGIIGILSFVSIVNRGEQDTIIVCALYSISLIFQMTQMIQYWFQAKLISKYISITSLFAYVLVSVYKIYLLVTEKSMYWFSVANAFDYLIISVILFIIYYKLGGQRLLFSFSRFRTLFSKSKYYIVSGMMITVFSQTDKIMIKLMMGDAQTGFYTAAATCTTMTSFVFTAIIDSFRPVIFEYKLIDEAKYDKNIKRLYSIIIYVALLQSFVLTVFSGFIIDILYGAEYFAASSILRVLTWYGAFSYMGSVRNIWILAEGKQKYLWIINLCGAVLNVIGNFILINLWGAEGAALSSVITQLFTNVILCVIIKPIRPCFKIIVKSLNPKLIFELISSYKIRK